MDPGSRDEKQPLLGGDGPSEFALLLAKPNAFVGDLFA